MPRHKDLTKIKSKYNEYDPKKLQKFGVVFDDLNMSQKVWQFIERANFILSQTTDIDCVAFVKNMSNICVKPNFGVMFIHEMWNFDGVLVATDLPSAEQVSKVVNNSKKVFYIWDLEWVRPPHAGGQKDFIRNVDIFNNKELKLVARNVDHAAEITRYCNRQVDGINDNFDIYKILDLYGAKNG